MIRCIYCGLCEEVCPEEAIFLLKDYAITGLTRGEMVHHKDKLYELGGTAAEADSQVGREEVSGRRRHLTPVGKRTARLGETERRIETDMDAFFFWLFSLGMLGFGLAVILNRNPVASALCFAFSIVFMAGLFVQLSAFFLAAVQILVTAGAVMVLFLFIIMLLNPDRDGARAAAARLDDLLALVLGLGFVASGGEGAATARRVAAS